MPAAVVLLAVLGGFGLVVVTVEALNGGALRDFGGLFPARGRNDRPQGVQETDVPRFAVEHVDRLRTTPATSRSIQDITAAEWTTFPTERIDAQVRRLAL